jgi:hypothetical protein
MPFVIDAVEAGGRKRRPARPVRAGAGRSMPDRWAAAAGYSCLMVALYVAAPAIVTLTVHDHVQLDRVTGTSAERHGGLLPPGTTQVSLAAGMYLFRTTGDAQVQLTDGSAVTVTAVAQSTDKGDWPDALADGKGDSLPDHVPALTVLR